MAILVEYGWEERRGVYDGIARRVRTER